MNKENIILIDFPLPKQWEFHQGIEKETGDLWKVIGCTSNQLRTNIWKKICRYIRYFSFPWKIFCNRKSYNKIIAWQQFYGLIFAFFEKIFHVKKENYLVVMTFIYKEKKWGGRLYYNFIKYIIESDYVDKLVVFSSSEKRYYSELFNISEDKFFCTNIGIEDISDKYKISNNGRMLAVGRSNRDYDFLISSLKGTGVPIDIICDTVNFENEDNIIVYKNISGDAYYKMLARCNAVIIPLKERKISSGQLVILQAMMMGKPLIITEAESIKDYVTNEKTALIIEKNKKDLLMAINRVYEDLSLYKTLQIQERSEYEENYSLFKMGCNIGRFVKKG